MAAAPDPDEALRSTKEKGNFQRLARLLMSEGITLMREIFDLRCPPSNLPTILTNPATEKQLKAAKLAKPQWDCLYPSPGMYGKSADFDVTLLFRLLRTIFDFNLASTGWDTLPTSTDHSLAADLARIKYYRNSVYGHVNQTMEITDEEFQPLWIEISEALVEISGQTSPAKKREWQVAVINFLKNPVFAEDKRDMQELLRWYENEIEVKKSIVELKTSTQEGMERLETSLKGVQGVIEEKGKFLESAVREEPKRVKDHFRGEMKTTTQNAQYLLVQEEAQDIKDKLGEMHQSIDGLCSLAGSSQAARTARQLNTSELSITEFYSIDAITKQQQEQYEKVVPKYTPRPTIDKEKFDDSKYYNFVLFDTETYSTGKSAEICQLAAVDRSGKQFVCYILPNKGTDSYASKVNKLTVKTVNATRRLLKENQPVVISPLAEVLREFITFLKESTNTASSQTTKPVCTVLAGHNAATFDIPVLLRNGGEDFIAELDCINCIRFADTLTLFKSLIQSKHSSLLDAEDKFPKPNLSSLYQHFFQTTFDAHDALEDVIALRRILFSLRLGLSDELLVNRSSVISVKDAAEDMKWLDNRHQRLLSLRGKLYIPGSPDSPIKQSIAEKISGSGLGYEDLKIVFQRFGRKGLVCILTRPPLSCRSASRPRVTNTKRIVSAIVRYFEQNFRDSDT